MSKAAPAKKGKVFLLILVILSLAICTKLWLQQNPWVLLPINRVEVQGTYQHVLPANIQNQLKPLVNKSFFFVNTDAIRQLLLTIPWIGNVMVQRVWPDKIVIAFSEHQAIANWNNQSLVNEFGNLFTVPAAEINPHLPLFKGPEGQSKEVLNGFQEMMDILSPYHLYIDGVALTDRLSWEVRLKNGLILYLGRDDMGTRLHNFLMVYSGIPEDKRSQIDYMDLRYSDGVAIHWKTPIKQSH